MPTPHIAPCDSTHVEVSVIIPIHGYRRALRRAVASVLDQENAPTFELLLIDDASPDDAFSDIGHLLDDPRVRSKQLAINGGPSAARNAGVALARGRYVAFLDSDDEWQRDKLARQCAAAREAGDPELFLSTSACLRLMPGGRRKRRPSRGPAAGERAGDYLYVFGGMAQTSSMFASRALALAVPFDARLRQYEDHLFFISAIEHGACYRFLDEPLSVYHDEGEDGRLSRGATAGQYDLYEPIAAPFLSHRALLALRARYRARLILPDQPREAVGLVLAAWFGGALRARFLAGFLRLWLRQLVAGRTKIDSRYG